MSDRLEALANAGVSIWLDDLSRERIESGNLAELIATSGVVGVTTNPSIFASALAKGEKYELVGSEVPDFLGYGDVEPPLVPSAWLEFFQPGVQLSTNSARRVPEDAPPADDAAADAG